MCGSFGHVPTGSPMEAMLDRGADQWGTGTISLELSPALRQSSGLVRRSLGFLERASASPHMAKSLVEFIKTIDIRPRCPPSRRRSWPCIASAKRSPIAYAREIAAGVPNGRIVEVEGDDHLPWVGNAGEYFGAIEEFLTGSTHAAEPARSLSTVLFTDIVSSTSRNAELGDDAWRRLLDRHNQLVREALAEHRGSEIKTIGDGFLSTFDGPARACAARKRSWTASRISASRFARVCTPARSSCTRTVTLAAWQ